MTEISHYALLVNGDYGWYFLNPLLDLMANCVGLESSYFGKIPHLKGDIFREKYPYLHMLNREYVYKLDKQLDLLNGGGVYLDYFLDMLSKEMMDKKLTYPIFDANLTIFENKINFASKHLFSLGKDLGVYERKQFYERIIYSIFSRKERAFVHVHFIDNETLAIYVNSSLELLVFVEDFDKEQYRLVKRKV